MFTVDTTITDLRIKERDLAKVLFSMNTHQVATPDLSPEEARSYIFFFREGGRILSYVGLHFLLSDRKMYFRYSENPFPESNLPAAEDEARSFAEDLGAMLDELNLDNMSDVEKDRWIDEQDIFSEGEKTQESAGGREVSTGGSQPDRTAAALPQAISPPSQPAPAQPKAAAPGPAPASSADKAAIAEDGAGRVKAPQPQLKREVRSSPGALKRDREALARLLASF